MEQRVIISVDELTLEECLQLARHLGHRAYAVKIHSLFDRYGREAVQRLKQAAAWKVWVDAKLHDIPNTARLRAQEIAGAGADIISVHASGGIAMMRAAKASGAIVYGVTVLTSLTREETSRMYGRPLVPTVLTLALMAKEAGLDGIVSSAHEARFLSARPELQGWEFITPGIRSEGEEGDDQQRTDTPLNALLAGATRLVVGRQITRAKSPVDAYDALERDVGPLLGQFIDKKV